MEGEPIAEIVTRIVFQLALVLVAAKLTGEVFERYLHITPVLGELAAGILIGPYALGGMRLGGIGPVFPVAEHVLVNPVAAVPLELYVIAQIAAIILLFSVGLETNLRQFLKYSGPALLVAAGGVALPFALGSSATVAMGFAPSLGSPLALFMGAILTATSVGITARVLSDLGSIASPEGVTIIGAAVVDDVLVILVLTVVIAFTATGEVSLGELGLLGAKAMGFWVVLTGLMILASKWISRFFMGLRVAGAALVLALAVALLGAGLAETFGLAMIIGAYSVGLGLSGTPLARRIEEHLEGVYNFLVPVFFVAMGMLVDVSRLGEVLVFGGVLTLLAIIGKVAGAGIPALAVGFNRRGAWRIGVGMLPRGEVGLIVAGAGLAGGAIGTQEFGVAIMVVLVTTPLAMLLLVPAFRSGLPGTRRATDA